jgi:hypothetical protein
MFSLFLFETLHSIKNLTVCICESLCDGKKITMHLTNTCKFELIKRENNNGRTKLGGAGFTKSHAESLYSLIYGLIEPYFQPTRG